jgi:hypothetical protein
LKALPSEKAKLARFDQKTLSVLHRQADRVHCTEWTA